MSLPSPCIGVCALIEHGPACGLCRGCWRTLGEIAAWGEAGDAGRAAILREVAQRRVRFAAVAEAAPGNMEHEK